MSRFFDNINKVGAPCPLCNTKDDGQVLLCPIPGTEDGNNMEAKQVHKRCAQMLAQIYIEAMMQEDNCGKAKSRSVAESV